MGFFYRTIRMVENGIKPAYVFDGKPPEMKKGVVRIWSTACLDVVTNSGCLSKLSKRFERREEAKAEGEEAKETGTAEDLDRFTRRTVKVTREHNEECRRLLGLMGIPVVIVGFLTYHCILGFWFLTSFAQAPSEAEAQCAELARGGKVCPAYQGKPSLLDPSWYTRYMRQALKIWTP